MTRLRADLVAAFMLLTRLPVARFSRTEAVPDPAGAVWAYPVVGVVVGGIAGAAFWLARAMHVPPALAAVWTLAVLVLVTGGLHEDGAADTADGLGGGRTGARRLEIMRDSRIGSYGALALVLSLAVRGSALTTVGRPALVMVALVVAGAMGRAAMAMLLASMGPARSDGMAAGLGRIGLTQAVLAAAIAAVIGFLLLPAWPAVATLAATLVCAALTGRLAIRLIGGYTGDILGAAETITECVVLTLITSL